MCFHLRPFIRKWLVNLCLLPSPTGTFSRAWHFNTCLYLHVEKFPITVSITVARRQIYLFRSCFTAHGDAENSPKKQRWGIINIERQKKKILNFLCKSRAKNLALADFHSGESRRKIRMMETSKRINCHSFFSISRRSVSSE